MEFFHTTALGSMGFGIPAAIGACLGGGGRPTVVVDGDGGFQFNIQELETVKRLKLPIKFFVLNNEGYGLDSRFAEGVLRRDDHRVRRGNGPGHCLMFAALPRPMESGRTSAISAGQSGCGDTARPGQAGPRGVRRSHRSRRDASATALFFKQLFSGWLVCVEAAGGFVGRS